MFVSSSFICTVRLASTDPGEQAKLTVDSFICTVRLASTDPGEQAKLTVDRWSDISV
ncbi:hypothetical protein J6590_003100 [Homalodisca vitripennis]|nr:hypothetical protein J6590_003100 [Homalodisca vitripennis]